MPGASKITYGLMVLIGAIIIGFTVFFSLQDIYAMHWSTTQGALLSQDTQTASYSYEVNGKSYVLKNRIESLTAPQTVSVHFNPQRPGQCTTISGLPPISVVTIMFGTILTIFGFIKCVNPTVDAPSVGRYGSYNGINPGH